MSERSCKLLDGREMQAGEIWWLKSLEGPPVEHWLLKVRDTTMGPQFLTENGLLSFTRIQSLPARNWELFRKLSDGEMQRELEKWGSWGK